MGLLAIGVNDHFASNACGQHHHAHDALGIDAALAFGNPNFTWKTTRQLGQLGRSSGMQAQLIADGRRSLGHVVVLIDFEGQCNLRE